MADPLGVERIERVADRGRAAPFARMDGDAQPRLPRAFEGPEEIARFALQLIARHAEADQPVARGLGRALRDGARAVGAEMADAGDDAAKGDAKLRLRALGLLPDGGQVFAPGFHIAAAAEVGAEEGLRIDHAVRRAFLQHGAGQAGVILGRVQDAGGRLVDRQEVPEILVGIAAVGREDTADIDALLLRQPPDESGRRGALVMQVQFDFRQFSHVLKSRWPSR
jgi:hypothetical protein